MDGNTHTPWLHVSHTQSGCSLVNVELTVRDQTTVSGQHALNTHRVSDAHNRDASGLLTVHEFPALISVVVLSWWPDMSAMHCRGGTGDPGDSSPAADLVRAAVVVPAVRGVSQIPKEKDSSAN